ncbi:class I SAM-dependent rRNA methyltransferase [Leptospira sp. 96542]|nr:class I SAM-dependent rRNA methyltransferase [Leptospira sp. 96542]
MVIRLKKNKEKALLNFHPWIFSGAIASGEKNIKPGGIVRVESDSGSFLAWGFYDPKSQIRIRLFSFLSSDDGDSVLFWNQKWEYLWASKTKLLPKQTTGFRFLHSEGDGVPGIIVDIYDKAAVLQIRTPGAKTLTAWLVSFLITKGMETIVERVEPSDGETKANSNIWHLGSSAEIPFLENGIRFLSDIATGQKTGFFLDQRENRNLLKRYSENRIVLNCFAYSGGFSLYALLGGAKLVHSLDISKEAIQLCEKTVEINTIPDVKTRHRGIVENSFSYLKDMETNFYDMIVLDPPAFTKSITTVNQASKGYKEINLKAIQKICSGGLIFTFSCSQHISMDLFKKIVFGAAKDTKRNVRVLHQMTQSPDHGHSIYHPEGEYLKGLVIQVD